MYNAVFKIIWLIHFNPNNLPTSTFYLLIMLIIIPIWVPHTVYQKSKLLSVFLEDLLLRQKSCCSKMLCQTLREYQKSNFYQSVDLQHILCRVSLDWEPKHLHRKSCNHTLYMYICSKSYCFDYIFVLYFCFPNHITAFPNISVRGYKINKSLTTAWIVLRFKRMKCTCQPHQNPLTKLLVAWLWFPNTSGWFRRGISVWAWVFSWGFYINT